MFDWLGRTLLLILSGLATFAILASLESASRGSGTLGSRLPPMESAPEPRAPPPNTVPETPIAASREPGSTAPGGTARVAVPTPAPTKDDQIARLLEALTYAVLALAGFAAAILLVLLRITAHLARIAGRS